MYETSRTKIFATPSDNVRDLSKELQESHELVHDTINVKQEQQVTYYDRKHCGLKNNVNGKVLLFNPILCKGHTKKLRSFLYGSHVIKEIESDLNFVIHDQKIFSHRH